MKTALIPFTVLNRYIITFRHDLAIQGFQWATDTIQKKVDKIPYVSDNRSEMLADGLNFSEKD